MSDIKGANPPQNLAKIRPVIWSLPVGSPTSPQLEAPAGSRQNMWEFGPPSMSDIRPRLRNSGERMSGRERTGALFYPFQGTVFRRTRPSARSQAAATWGKIVN